MFLVICIGMNDKLKCKICGFEGKSLVSHLRFKHFVTIQDYKTKYNENVVMLCSDEWKKKISETLKKHNEDETFRKENSNRQKNGASIYTLKYWTNRKGLSINDAKKMVSNIQKRNSQKHLDKDDLQECSHFSKKYWIKRGYSEENAKIEVSKLQAKLSAKSSKFLGHTRTNEDKEKISSSMKKTILQVGKGIWASHFGEFSGRSKMEIEFYNYIKNNVDPSIEANIPVGNYIVDIIKNKKIIEFYGDFWHANPLIFCEDKMLKDHLGGIRMVRDIWKKDKIRIKTLIDSGYEVMIIWEMDWNKNKQECIDKVRKYLV